MLIITPSSLLNPTWTSIYSFTYCLLSSSLLLLSGPALYSLPMSYSLTPLKRPRNLSPQDSNGQGKLPKIQPHQFKLRPANTTTLRLLCPLTKIGGVIGKAGHVISKIRQDTGAKVKVEDLVPGCDERVIVISASDKETQVTTQQEDASTEHCEADKDKQPDTLVTSEPEKETPSMLKALLLIFERMIDGDKEMDKDSDEASALVARLLVLTSQVGPLLGEDGNAIKHMSSETGAQIHLLPRDKVPPCVSASDELLQITGGSDAVVKALQFVCQQLLGIPPKDHESFSPNSKEPPSTSSGNSLSTAEVFESPKHSLHSQGSPRDAADYTSDQPMRDPKYHESGRMDLTFRLLCHEDNVGGVIGKEGAIVKTLQQETGCEIKILDRINDSEDRIIVISGPAHPEDRISAPQEAVLRVQTRIDRSVPDIMDKRSTAKIIIPTNQIECLLGKDGSIIAEIKKSSGAFIEIVEKDQIPKSASENEEVIQINGEHEAVQEALTQITARLQHYFFRDMLHSINHPSSRKELPPGGGHPHDGFNLYDDGSEFMHDSQRPAFPSRGSGRNLASAPWGSQTSGGSAAVRKSPQDHGSLRGSSNGTLSNTLGNSLSMTEVFELRDNSFHDQGRPFAAGPRDATDYPSSVPLLPPRYRENGGMNPYEDILTFRLLCHEDNIGGVIGKGGAVIRALHYDTGCEIKVSERIKDSEDRIIVISGPAHPDDRLSAPQDAVLCVQTRIVRAASDTMGKKATAKIIVPSNQIGCLIGKGGSIIAEMRKSSGAFIKILGKDQIPSCASEHEEVIQMNGDFEAVQDALFQITARLKQHFFGDSFNSVSRSSNHSFHDQVLPFPSYMGRRDLSPPGGLPPRDGFYHPDERSDFMHNNRRPAFPSHVSGRNPPSQWGSRGGHGDIGGPEGFPGAPTRRIGEFGGATHSPVITNTTTTMQVIVPQSVLPCIYGEGGGCLEQILQISDAKITIPEVKGGAKEVMIVISGTPEEAHAAQSLIQAFVMLEANEDGKG